ncbi:MAG: hypothetical protein JEZ00_21965 [Anaerolineaceae bacterium]|nr:hypothetical protein [Anaerolineaceae bacterium]
MEKSPDLFYEKSWQDDMLKILGDIKLSCAALDEISPVPPKFIAVNEYIIESSNEYDLVVQYMTEGITESTSSKFRLATEHMKIGSEYDKKISQEIVNILDQ